MTGPSECHPYDETCGGPGGPCRNHGGLLTGPPGREDDPCEANAAFIAAARTDIAALLADRVALAARLAEVEGEVERLREPFAQRERIERLIEASSLGSPEAKAARDRVPMEVGIAITKAADYLGRAKRAEAERDEARAAVERGLALADDFEAQYARNAIFRTHADRLRAALRGEAGEGRADLAVAIARVTPCSCSVQRARAEAAEAELAALADRMAARAGEVERAEAVIALLQPSPNRDECELKIRRSCMEYLASGLVGGRADEARAEGAVLRVRRIAESNALTTRALGRQDDERRWLDLLHVLDRIESGEAS
jgi:hypothetical protein